MQYANQLLQPFMNWDFNFFGDLKVSDDTSWNFFEAGRTLLLNKASQVDDDLKVVLNPYIAKLGW